MNPIQSCCLSQSQKKYIIKIFDLRAQKSEFVVVCASAGLVTPRQGHQSPHTTHVLAAVLQGRARAHCMLLQLASPGAGLGVDKGRERGCESYIRVLGGGMAGLGNRS